MKRIAVTMGDPAGIGGEIIVKALPCLGDTSIPVIIGDRSLVNLSFQKFTETGGGLLKPYGEGDRGDCEIVDCAAVGDAVQYGTTSAQYGRASYAYIVEALERITAGEVAGLVTCPISKAAIHQAGIDFPGHTEMLAHFGGVSDYVMMMANRQMKVSLVTIHIPLKDVPAAITVQNVLKVIVVTDTSLRERFGIAQPYIKVCGLNPHAGEQGIIGNEEDAINEAIRRAQLSGVFVEGPFPADTLFHKQDCDAYVAMYHDQGLIPVKTVDFERTVNITLGLPFVRTSPGHGTGFDIAGKGLASPTGLIEAYRVAEHMVSGR